MGFQYGMQRGLKIVCSVILATVVLFIAYAPGEAYKLETRGFVLERSKDKITIITSDNRGKETFRVNDATKVINTGLRKKVWQIPRHSVVKVTSDLGVALEILVEGVPK